MRAFAFFLTALSFLYFPAAYGEPEVSVRAEYYRVEGNTVEELSNAMKRNAPAKMGEHFGSTKWNVIWDYKSLTEEGVCSVTTVNVKLEVVFYLPEWKDAAAGDKKVRRKWEKFMKKLQNHEDGHKKIGVEAARKIEKIFNQSGNFKDCQELDLVLNRSAQAVMTEKRAEEARYDLRTRHGLRQGARLKYTKPKPEEVLENA